MQERKERRIVRIAAIGGMFLGTFIGLEAAPVGVGTVANPNGSTSYCLDHHDRKSVAFSRTTCGPDPLEAISRYIQNEAEAIVLDIDRNILRTDFTRKKHLIFTLRYSDFLRFNVY